MRTSRSKRRADFIALLDQIDAQYGLMTDRATKPIVRVLDNGPIHTSKATRAALTERAPWLTVEGLPKYAPELDDIEELWRDLKQHHLAQRTFAGPENLSPHPEEVRSTVSKDEGVSSVHWILLRDATSWLLRMRTEIDEPDSQENTGEVPLLT